MNSSNPLEMSRQADEMPDLNLDFPNFDLFVATGDPNNAASNQMQMDSLSGPHSTHPSPMLNPIPDHTQGYSTPQMVGNAEIARLQHHIEQQRRLNELNQLQNRILQQQLEIMGCPPPTPHVPVGYQGLITPGGVHQFAWPMVYDPNLVSSALGNHADLYRSLLSPAMTPHLMGVTSHPSPFPQTHHGTPTDFLSPLTSPAIQPSPNPHLSFGQGTASAIPSPAQKSFPPLPSPSFGPSRSKRSATSDVEAVRKRASPLVKPTPPSKAATSAKRTPRTRPRGDSVVQPRASPLPSPHPSGTIEPVGDLPNSTPSPVDLSATFSMPPPAVPIARSSPGQEVDTIMEQPESADATPAASTNGSPSLAPVTPASLMNLGHNATQPTGLRHGPDGPQLGTSDLPSETASASRDATTSSKKDKTKEANHVFKVPKGKVAIPKAGTSVRQSPAILPMISPAIKSGLTAEAIAHLSTKSNYQNTLEGRAVALGINPSSSNSSYGPDGRKTSHKAAEQKRRDSLKAGFDDLRLLLPPITLSACAELDPGAAPPRGPPRNVPGGEDNPNRAVSKLALLRFSNEWIVKLGRRVERRDSAIEELKKEIQMLREKLGPNADLPPGCDLDANIDAIEEDNEENKSARMASRPTEKLKSQVAAIAEHDEEDGEEAD
ncbi:Helix-loop-helix DNA-binding domain [Rhizoctonia solani]|uniref:Helix-loop-helix DNA-binding domain n=1 Tax=Rhizoctonia solani TaxID=456999 RepID=A0A8H7LJK2_9AGAM|nr:Helix-loop-helix DNA-binding domain [Rhizoctonia solani]